MMDILLFYNVLKAMPDKMSLVLIGDTDQLPSVGAGNVLGDMINSGVIPAKRLKHIFRQARGSQIITNAHRINNGVMPKIFNNNNTNFFFIERKEPEEIASQIIELCSRRLPLHYKVDPISDIQVLAPMRRGVSGADNLNIQLQAVLNPQGTALRRGATEYKVGDKVMQIRNNYEKQVYNGDMGIIWKADSVNKVLSVDFDGRIVNYDILELDELVLSYAITIHKSQGGEFPIVVIPFSMSSFIMLSRNLLYTGITRAKKVAILVGEKRAVGMAVHNDNAGHRNTMLADRLKSLIL